MVVGRSRRWWGVGGLGRGGEIGGIGWRWGVEGVGAGGELGWGYGVVVVLIGIVCGVGYRVEIGV